MHMMVSQLRVNLMIILFLNFANANVTNNAGDLDSGGGSYPARGRTVTRERSLDTRLIRINKCCPWRSFFDADHIICRRTDELDKVRDAKLKSDFLESYVKNPRRVEEYDFVVGVPECDESRVVVSQVTSNFSCDEGGPKKDGRKIEDGYCIDGRSGRGTMLVQCRNPAQVCGDRPCIRKCKAFGDFFGMEDEDILDLPPLTPEFYNLKTLEPDRLTKLSHFGLHMGNECGGRGRHKLSPEFEPEDLYYLGTNGKLYVPDPEEKFYTADEFCIEYVKVENFSEVSAFLCFPEIPSDLKYYLLAAGFLISCVCLLATFLVYLFSPKTQNLYGKCLMCYVASLFGAYLTLAIIELNTNGMGKIACIVAGYSTLFFFLTAFFWLNIMSIDMWKTFRCIRSAKFNKASKEKTQFLWYSLYAWSVPCLITGLCAAADFIPDFVPPSIRPDMGENTCWFSKHRKGIYIFLIAPISSVIICNTILYINTAWRCWKIKSEIQRMGNQSRKRYSTSRTQFIINGKLFIVMGVVWSFEVISFFFDHPIWYISDAANALHGVLIFAIFVLKKKVLSDLPGHIKRPFIRMKNIRKKTSDDVSEMDDFNSSRRNYSATSTYVTDVNT